MVKRLVLVVGMVLLFGQMAFGVELTHWHNQQGRTKKVTDTDLAKEFMVKNPWVDIKVEEYPSSALGEMIQTRIASDSTPNTYRDYLGRLTLGYYAGVTEDLSGLMDMSDFYPDVVKGFVIDGKLIGIPTVFWTQVYGVNENYFDEVGVKVPSGAWTLAEWTDVARKIKTIGVWPTTFHTKGGDYWNYITLAGFGAKVWTDSDYTKTTLNSNEGVAGLEWMVEMEEIGLTAPGTVGRGAGEIIEMLNTGKVAMCPMSTRQGDEEYQRVNLSNGLVTELQRVRVVESPRLAELPSPASPFGPSGVIVFSKDNQEEVYWAKEWVKFITSKEKIDWQAISDGQNCPRISVNPHIENQAFARALEILADNGAYDNGIGGRNYTASRAFFTPALEFAFLGIKTVREALDDFAREIEGLNE